MPLLRLRSKTTALALLFFAVLPFFTQPQASAQGQSPSSDVAAQRLTSERWTFGSLRKTDGTRYFAFLPSLDRKEIGMLLLCWVFAERPKWVPEGKALRPVLDWGLYGNLHPVGRGVLKGPFPISNALKPLKLSLTFDDQIKIAGLAAESQYELEQIFGRQAEFQEFDTPIMRDHWRKLFNGSVAAVGFEDDNRTPRTVHFDLAGASPVQAFFDKTCSNPAFNHNPQYW